MKLHTLDIQAFGPFADHQHIDFGDLGDNPLFLIDGATGAGKSSILHAICYALYGETTDEARKDFGMRCDNAAAELLTEVSLEFSIREQHYRITRLPLQIRQAKRGAGVTEQKPVAHLRKILADGAEETLVTKKKTAADEQIKLIIGLSAEQFRQVMVLPQGKFRELLLAKSDARQAILSTLFQTEIYKRIEQLLKDKAINIDREYKKFNEQINESLSEVFVDNNTALAEAISSAEHYKSQLEQQKQAADQSRKASHNQLKSATELEKAFAGKVQKQQALTQHMLAEAENIDKTKQINLVEKAFKITPIWQALKQANIDGEKNQQQLANTTNNLQQLQQSLQQATAKLTLAQQEFSQRDGLLAELNKLQNYLLLNTEFAAIQTNAMQAQQSEKEAQQKLENASKELFEYSMRSEKGQQYVESLQTQITNKAQLQMAQSQGQQQVVALQKQEALQQKITKLKQQVVSLTERFKHAEQQFKLAETNANTIEMHWHSNQAAVLAKTLQQDAPCPVCGSIEHPMPATIAGGLSDVSKQAVDEARTSQNQYLNTQNEADKTLLQAQESLNQHLQQYKQQRAELGDVGKQASTVLAQEIAQITEQLTIALQTEAKIEPAQKKLALMLAKLPPIEQLITNLRQAMPALNSASGAAKAKLSNAEQSLPEQYRNPQNLNNAISLVNDKIVTLDKQLNTAQLNCQQGERNLSAMQAKNEQLSQNQQQLLTRINEQQTLWQKALGESEFANENEFERVIITELELSQLKQQKQQFEQIKNELTSQLNLLTEQLTDKQQPDLAELQKINAEQEALFKQVEQDWAMAQTQLTRLNEVQTKINRLETEQAEHKKQYEIIGTLASAAGGRGKVRVSLERFVLGDLLDSVLAIASKRLNIMSKGQYRLVRQNEGEQKKNVTAGLDLAIDDAYTGKTRPVATLSGGESFIASLALALGLSDVVQQRSGGIQLDTLFIDEGFGSLDQESLQLAIETLIDLQASGRTIGIISHVSELKEQMALRIDVQSSRHGSTIKTVAKC